MSPVDHRSRVSLLRPAPASSSSRFTSDAQSIRTTLQAQILYGSVLNHVVYGNPNGSLTSGTFGQITGLAGSDSYPERMIQAVLRFSF
jgi:hypothetical protein